MRTTWNEIAPPILRTLQEMEGEEGGIPHGAQIGAIAERLRKEEAEIAPQLESLADGGYLSIRDNAATFGNPYGHYGIKLGAIGRQALGEWPTNPVEALATALHDAAFESGSPEERSRFQTLAKRMRQAGEGLKPVVVAAALEAPLEAAVG